jgi:hypothetical protein
MAHIRINLGFLVGLKCLWVEWHINRSAHSLLHGIDLLVYKRRSLIHVELTIYLLIELVEQRASNWGKTALTSVTFVHHVLDLGSVSLILLVFLFEHLEHFTFVVGCNWRYYRELIIGVLLFGADLNLVLPGDGILLLFLKLLHSAELDILWIHTFVNISLSKLLHVKVVFDTKRIFIALIKFCWSRLSAIFV